MAAPDSFGPQCAPRPDRLESSANGSMERERKALNGRRRNGRNGEEERRRIWHQRPLTVAGSSWKGRSRPLPCMATAVGAPRLRASSRSRDRRCGERNGHERWGAATAAADGGSLGSPYACVPGTIAPRGYPARARLTYTCRWALPGRCHGMAYRATHASRRACMRRPTLQRAPGESHATGGSLGIVWDGAPRLRACLRSRCRECDERNGRARSHVRAPRSATGDRESESCAGPVRCGP